MKLKSCSPLVAAFLAAFLVVPLWAQDQKPSQASPADVKAAKATFQKALAEAKKDPAVADALKAANIMALKKVADTDPSLAEMANKEIAKIENAGNKPAAGEGKKPKKDGDATAPAKETGDKPASPESKEKPAKQKKVADTNAPAKESKPVSPESKKKAEPKAPATEAAPAASEKATNS